MGTAISPFPSSAPATLRPDLAGTFMEWDFAGNMSEFRGTRALPIIEVAEKSGTFPRVATEELAKLAQTIRSYGAGYSRGQFKVTTDTYSTQEYGREEVVDDNLAATYRNLVDAEMVCAARARHILMASWEQTLASMIFNTSTWTPTPITNEWDDFANADPIGDVEAAKQRIRTRTGLEANAVIFSRKVMRNVRQCEAIIDRLQAQGAGVQALPGQITEAKLAELFDVPNVIVVGGSYDSARETATSTFTDIWDDEYCMVCRVATSQDISDPCIGRTFHWAEDGSMPMGTFEEYYENAVRGKVIRFRRQVGAKIIYAELGDLLSNITS